MFSRLLIILMLSLLLVGACIGADSTTAKFTDATWLFAGPKFDFEPGVSAKVNAGWAIPTSKSLWIIPNFDVGDIDSTGSRSSAINVDISWMALSGQAGALHLLLSPGVDWVAQEYSVPSYLSGAIGGFGLVYLRSFWHAETGFLGFVAKRFSIYAGLRYKTDLSSIFKHTEFPRGLQIGFGLTANYGQLRS